MRNSLFSKLIEFLSVNNDLNKLLGIFMGFEEKLL